MVKPGGLSVFCMKPNGFSKFNQKEAAAVLACILPPDLANICAAFAANLPPLPFVSNWELWKYAQPEYDQQGHYGSLPMMQIETGQQINHGF